MAGTLVANTINTDTGLFSTNNAYSGIAKAWLNYNGVTQTINGSFNVSSVTRNGTGDYTVNFSTAMVNANYSICGNGFNAGNGIILQITSIATGNVRVQLTNASVAGYDSSIVTVSVFGA